MPIVKQHWTCIVVDIPANELYGFYQLQPLVGPLTYNKENGRLKSITFLSDIPDYSTIWSILNTIYDTTDCTAYGLVKTYQKEL